MILIVVMNWLNAMAITDVGEIVKKKEVLQEAKLVIDKNFSKTNMLNKYLKLYESV